MTTAPGWKPLIPEKHMPSDADLSDAPKNSQAKLTTHTTSHSEQCTAIELTSGSDTLPLFIVDPDGNVLCKMSMALFDDGQMSVAIVDVERQFGDAVAVVDDDTVYVTLMGRGC